MSDLKSMLDESGQMVEQLGKLREKISKELERVIWSEVTSFQQLTKDHIVNLNLHNLFTELANADLDCGEHFKRFDDTVTRSSKESKEDWDRCYNRRSAAISAITQVALAYVHVARDVMEE
jgi:hypothetical protein